MNKVPVMVMRNKTNPERYLALSADVGDWEDENLDVTLGDIQYAYMIVRKDKAVPTVRDFEEHKKFHAAWKQKLTEDFGPDAFISLDFEAVCEHYEPVNIEISGAIRASQRIDGVNTLMVTIPQNQRSITMERMLTKCCWAESEAIKDDGGNPESYYCKSCESHDPEMELVEFCPYCDRPGMYCTCP